MITHIQINTLGDKRGTFKVSAFDEDKYASKPFVADVPKTVAGGLIIQALMKMIEIRMKSEE